MLRNDTAVAPEWQNPLPALRERAEIIKRGKHSHQTARSRYECKMCGKHFDDWRGTVWAGHHQPLSAWILCLYYISH